MTERDTYTDILDEFLNERILNQAQFEKNKMNSSDSGFKMLPTCCFL